MPSIKGPFPPNTPPLTGTNTLDPGATASTRGSGKTSAAKTSSMATGRPDGAPSARSATASSVSSQRPRQSNEAVRGMPAGEANAATASRPTSAASEVGMVQQVANVMHQVQNNIIALQTKPSLASLQKGIETGIQGLLQLRLMS